MWTCHFVGCSPRPRMEIMGKAQSPRSRSGLLFPDAGCKPGVPCRDLPAGAVGRGSPLTAPRSSAQPSWRPWPPPPPVSQPASCSLPAGHQEALQPHPGGDLPLLLVPPPDQQPHLLHRRAGKGHPGGRALVAGGECLSPGLFLGSPALDRWKGSGLTAARGILPGLQTPPWL